MFVPDLHNNRGRLCSLPGDTVPRRWLVRNAVSGGRYLVRHVGTGRCRVVPHRSMSSLY
jgi:hypothetical protein